ncbi:MAG: heat shock protein HtpX [Candidatus Nanohaloarchaea archaeon]|jgi:heat shock protein HtpX
MVTSQGVKTNAKIFGFLSILTGVFLGVGYLIGGTGGMIIGLFFAGLMNFGSYWFSDKIVLKMYGAEQLSEEQYSDLHRKVEELADKAGIPKPKLYRNSMEVPNAFATGRNPEKGVVCVTQGLLDQLEKDEVEGVIAHELAHIKNRDTLINAVVATVAGAVALIAELAFWSSLFTGEDEGEMISALAFMIVTPIIATIIRMAVSRTMEFRADSEAVRIHGSKDGLSNALEKISASNKGYKSRKHVSKVQETGSNLFIENPFSADSLTKYFSTHPPLKERLENIQSTEIEV